MSRIFGYISRSGAPLRQGLAHDMMQASNDWNPDRSDVAELPHALLSASLLHTTAESINETLPYTCSDLGLTITADARIDNRDELSPVLGLTDNAQTADSIYILHAYRKWGKDCGKHLIGDYAFAIWDSRNRELFCARDFIGARALFYYADRDKFIFATEPKVILASGEAPTQLTEDWIANILVGVYPAKDQAPFEQMKKLPPAHYLTVTPENIRLEQYWDLDVTREIRYKREQDYYDHMRALIEQAVRRCTRSAFPVGAELSGGLDSSGIAAFAHAELKKRGEELSTFSHALPDWALGKVYPFEDEKQFIESLCAHAGITRKHYIYAEGKGILDEFRLCNQRFDYPTGYTLPIFCDALYEKAQAENVKVLLSGFPGDELVTSHGAEFYNELFHNRRFHTMWRDMHQRRDQRLFKTGYAFTVKMMLHYTPGIYRLLKGQPEPEVNWRDNSFRCVVTTDEYAERMRLRERLFETTTYPTFNSVRAREKVRITETFVCHRLEQCAAHAAYYGLEYRNPFADRTLSEYILALPSEIKVRNRFARYPYRMAVAGIVPEDVRWRTSKAGATIPTVMLRIIADNDRLDDLLRNVADRNIFPPHIDLSKMYDIKQRLDNKQLKDAVYPHSFYAAWMLRNELRFMC